MPGQFVDGPAYGLAPTPWDIQIYNTIPRYEDGQIFSPVPHTSSIKQCHKCVGLGRRPCENCMSMGKVLLHFSNAFMLLLVMNRYDILTYFDRYSVHFASQCQLTITIRIIIIKIVSIIINTINM